MGKTPVRKQRIEKYNPSGGLAGGYDSARDQGVPGSGATPGANPQYEEPTPLDKVVSGTRYVIKSAIDFTKRRKKTP